MLFINSQAALNQLCEQLRTCKAIGVDTEFMRKNTYYAQLSIIQIVTNKHKAIIDYLHTLDLTCLNEIFLDQAILKIFHSPREDFEIFYYLFKNLPKNIFDLQIAADLCGLGKSLSYGDLCFELLGVQIDKTHQRSDWLKRPLTPDMLDYAITDVENLPSLCKILQKILIDTKKESQFRDQMDKLLNVKNYGVNSASAWKKVKFTNSSSSFIYKMKILAGYREDQASMVDLPRRHFIPDEDLVKICQSLPTNNKGFDKLNLTSRYLKNQKYRTQLADLCVAMQN